MIRALHFSNGRVVSVDDKFGDQTIVKIVMTGSGDYHLITDADIAWFVRQEKIDFAEKAQEAAA